MTTLSERLEQILRERGWSERKLAEQAGLKSPTHVGLLIKSVKSPKVDTLDKIAKAAGVSFLWLATGEGLPTDVRPSTDFYPNRAIVVDFARRAGFDESDITAITTITGFRQDQDPPVAEWFRFLERERARRLGSTPARTAVEPAVADAPPRGRR